MLCLAKPRQQNNDNKGHSTSGHHLSNTSCSHWPRTAAQLTKTPLSYYYQDTHDHRLLQINTLYQRWRGNLCKLTVFFAEGTRTATCYVHNNTRLGSHTVILLLCIDNSNNNTMVDIIKATVFFTNLWLLYLSKTPFVHIVLNTILDHEQQ